MKRILLLLVLFIGVGSAVRAHVVGIEWISRYSSPIDTGLNSQYGDGGAKAMAVDDSGNVFVTGTDSGDCVTIRYLHDGTVAWVNRFSDGEDNFECGYALVKDDWGNIYAAGYDDSGYLMIKYNYGGDTIWTRRYYGPGLYGIAAAAAIDPSGNLCVTGRSMSATNCPNIATIKYLPNGDTAWVRRFSSYETRHTYAFGIAADLDGNVIVVGTGVAPSGSYEYLLIKYEPDGDTAWIRYYDTPGDNDNHANAVTVDDSGSIYVTGHCNNSSVTIKYYPNGDVAWIGGIGNNDEGRDIALDGEGNVYEAGSTLIRITLTKYNPEGELLWSQSYNADESAHPEMANDVAVDDLGYVYVSGMGDSSYVVLKYSPSGVLMWNTKYDGPAHRKDWPTDLAVDKQRHVYVTGESAGGTVAPDFCTIKYWQACDCVPGDANGDGFIDMGDAIYIVNYIFKSGDAPVPYSDCTDDAVSAVNSGLKSGKGPMPGNVCSGDVNCDCVVEVGDAVAIINYVFKGGEAPCSYDLWLSTCGTEQEN